MRWIAVLVLFILSSVLNLAALRRRGKYRDGLNALGLLATGSAVLFLVFALAPSIPRRLLASLSPRGTVILGLVSLSLLLWVVGQFRREIGVRAAFSAASFILSASTLPPFLIFIFAPSAPSFWLLLSPLFLAAYLSQFLKGVRPRAVSLDAIEMREGNSGRKGTFRVAHLSDLHLCSEPAMEGALAPGQVLKAAKKALRWALDRAQFVVITGDLTDNGSKEEWDSLAALFRGLGPEEAARIYLVPGNHDLSIALDYVNDTDGNLWFKHEQQHRHFATSVLNRCPDRWRVRIDGADRTADCRTIFLR